MENKLPFGAKIYDINAEIQEQKRVIEHLKKQSGLTEDQLKKGREILRLKENLCSDEHVTPVMGIFLRQVYLTLADMLDFDYETALMIAEEEKILGILEEVQECNGLYCSASGSREALGYDETWDHFFSYSLTHDPQKWITFQDEVPSWLLQYDFVQDWMKKVKGDVKNGI